MDYLIRLVQVHQTFRRPEIEALAILAGTNVEFVYYDDNCPFCIVHLQSDRAAQTLIARSIMSYGIYELWGSGGDYDLLHQSVISNSSIDLSSYRTNSFRFDIDSFQGKRSSAAQNELIQSFSYLDFQGKILMKGAELNMCIFEDYKLGAPAPAMLYLGRWVAKSDRDAVFKYNLKKRKYISRTSMDSELSLVTANLVLAAPGKIMYDPFVGTGSFTVSCAHFGAMTLGSDIDGRSIRGSADRDLFSNFEQYCLRSQYLDSFIADLTHSPLRPGELFDGIICDPPYGVREGPKVLGDKHGKEVELILIDGVPAHTRQGYIHPKRAYAFGDMLQDVLDFAALMLVDGGRLSMWMPTANDEDIELAIPAHPGLKVVSVCVQNFNKWSRRLLTYERQESAGFVERGRRVRAVGAANDLNHFRKKYFQGFKISNGDTTKPVPEKSHLQLARVEHRR